MRLFITIIFISLLKLSVFAGQLKANLNYSTFYSPTSGPYVETFLNVSGSSVKYVKNENNKYQGTIEVTLLFKIGEDIKHFKKYNLLSPELDTLNNIPNFVNQERVPVENGVYEFEIQIKDLNSDSEPFTATSPLKIDYPSNILTVSSIQLIESIKKTKEPNILSKSGYDIIPYAFDFYPNDIEKIAFYTEIYNANKVLGNDSSLLITSSIVSSETEQVVGNFKSFKRAKAKEVNILLSSFTIKDLPSGNYYLLIEARSKQNDLLASNKSFFQRSNPEVVSLVEDYQNTFVTKYNKEDLDFFISSLKPISTDLEITFSENQLASKDEDLMRQYFYNFWLKRSASNPEQKWESYKKQVEKVEKLYKTPIKHGFETDRGRIYLKYKKPNTISERKTQSSSYPFEIWHYYGIDGRSNIKFVFYNPDEVTNDYVLLHSNLQGEYNNPQWKVMLHKRTNAINDPDQTQHDSYWGDDVDDLYNNPR